MLYLWLQSERQHFLLSAPSPSRRSHCMCIRPAAPWTRQPAAPWPPAGPSGSMHRPKRVCGSQTLQVHRPNLQPWKLCSYVPSGASKTQPELKKTTINYSQSEATSCEMFPQFKSSILYPFFSLDFFLGGTHVEQPCIFNLPKKNSLGDSWFTTQFDRLPKVKNESINHSDPMKLFSPEKQRPFLWRWNEDLSVHAVLTWQTEQHPLWHRKWLIFRFVPIHFKHSGARQNVLFVLLAVYWMAWDTPLKDHPQKLLLDAIVSNAETTIDVSFLCKCAAYVYWVLSWRHDWHPIPAHSECWCDSLILGSNPSSQSLYHGHDAQPTISCLLTADQN